MRDHIGLPLPVVVARNHVGNCPVLSPAKLLYRCFCIAWGDTSELSIVRDGVMQL